MASARSTRLRAPDARADRQGAARADRAARRARRHLLERLDAVRRARARTAQLHLVGRHRAGLDHRRRARGARRDHRLLPQLPLVAVRRRRSRAAHADAAVRRRASTRSSSDFADIITCGADRAGRDEQARDRRPRRARPAPRAAALRPALLRPAARADQAAQRHRLNARRPAEDRSTVRRAAWGRVATPGPELSRAFAGAHLGPTVRASDAPTLLHLAPDAFRGTPRGRSGVKKVVHASATASVLARVMAPVHARQFRRCVSARAARGTRAGRDDEVLNADRAVPRPTAAAGSPSG